MAINYGYLKIKHKNLKIPKKLIIFWFIESDTVDVLILLQIILFAMHFMKKELLETLLMLKPIVITPTVLMTSHAKRNLNKFASLVK